MRPGEEKTLPLLISCGNTSSKALLRNLKQGAKILEYQALCLVPNRSLLEIRQEQDSSGAGIACGCLGGELIWFWGRVTVEQQGSLC